MNRLLHLNSYYTDTPLYSEIVKRLDSKWEQFIYVPCKLGDAHKNKVSLKNGNLFFSNIISKWDKVFYFRKINKIFADYMKHNFVPHIVHAHNLFTDGVIAYKLYKIKGCQYVVSIRMTDLYLQYKYMIHRRWIANNALRNAKKIIFLSSVHRDDLLDLVNSKDLKKIILEKSEVVPNGVNEYWLNNIVKAPKDCTNDNINLLHIGRIVKYKNIDRTIDAVESLRCKGYNIQLTIIGGSYHNELDFYNEFLNKIKDKDFINYLGEIKDKEVLRDYYRKSDAMVMASVHELFGLIYIESISQNVPVVYGNGSGIGPYLKEENFAEGVDPYSVSSIAQGIENLLNRRKTMEVFSSFVNKFNWNDIVCNLNDIYNE